MEIDKFIKGKGDEILRIAKEHGVKSVRVFGSVARGEATEGSALDLLIEVGGPTTPWFPGGLVAELEELLGCTVEVVEIEALRKEIRERVLEEAVSL